MDPTQFDALARALTRLQSHVTTPRRAALKLLGGGAFGLALVQQVETDIAAIRKKRKKRLKLKALCTPGKDRCQKGLKCDSPTNRPTCSGSVPDDSNWCCVPPGGSCTECDCCGNYSCVLDDTNESHCVPNPE
jgi:hypothetical protein